MLEGDGAEAYFQGRVTAYKFLIQTGCISLAIRVCFVNFVNKPFKLRQHTQRNVSLV